MGRLSARCSLPAPSCFGRWRRLVPLAISHALMDGAGVVIGVLVPLLRGG